MSKELVGLEPKGRGCRLLGQREGMGWNELNNPSEFTWLVGEGGEGGANLFGGGVHHTRATPAPCHVRELPRIGNHDVVELRDANGGQMTQYMITYKGVEKL